MLLKTQTQDGTLRQTRAPLTGKVIIKIHANFRAILISLAKILYHKIKIEVEKTRTDTNSDINSVLTKLDIWQIMPEIVLQIWIFMFLFLLVCFCFFFWFVLFFYDVQFTKGNTTYNHQVHWKYLYLGEKIKIKKRIKNAINNIKRY